MPIIEIKAVHKLTNEHKAQIFNYLAATRITLGFPVNCCAYPKTEIIKVVR
jgi:GxxExxY protein